MKKYFSEKDLSNILFERIIWQLSGGSCLEGNYPGVIIRGTIIQVSIFRGQFFWDHCLGAILSWGAIVVGGNCPGGNYPGGNCPKTTIVGSTKLI